MTAMLAPYISMSIAQCEFPFIASCYPINCMQSVGETRLARLQMLLKKYSTLANLNEALGLARTDATLSQIKNQSTTSRGKPKFMGEALARRIETTLGLEYGWMDTAPTYAELHGENDRISHVIRVMETMSDWQRDQACKIVDALAQPAGAPSPALPSNGTHG